MYCILSNPSFCNILHYSIIITKNYCFILQVFSTINTILFKNDII